MDIQHGVRCGMLQSHSSLRNIFHDIFTGIYLLNNTQLWTYKQTFFAPRACTSLTVPGPHLAATVPSPSVVALDLSRTTQVAPPLMPPTRTTTAEHPAESSTRAHQQRISQTRAVNGSTTPLSSPCRSEGGTPLQSPSRTGPLSSSVVLLTVVTSTGTSQIRIPHPRAEQRNPRSNFSPREVPRPRCSS